MDRGLHTKWHLDPCSRLARIDMGRKVGGVLCPLLGELHSHLTQCLLGRGLPPYLWHLDPCSPLATRNTGRKLGGLCPLFGEGELGSHLKTIWPGSRPTAVPSFILIHPTVSPQYTNYQRYRQDREDRHDRQTGQRSCRIGRTKK